ncbi:MAG: alpha-hydroxy-acid oxidizing protein [Proteobacteria bacterium]|nr:alpha-hydroxy-acid oxidizing protein [Pseudomonadota bacterium]MCP4918340.1 alpha-hydroxy-acid oxidizing protein [Pseudomonadota bacterium]
MAVNLNDLRELAYQNLSSSALDYYRSGSRDERTLARNEQAWSEIELWPRVMVDVSKRTLETTVLGQRIDAPILVAPTAFHGLAHADAELGTARAARGTVMCLSTLSNTAVERVVATVGGPVWFQLYVYKDRGAARALVERAEAAGCSALVLTVDAPVLGVRERDVRNRFTLPKHLSMPNALPDADTLPEVDDSGLGTWFAQLLDESLSWNDLNWLASITSLPIVVKGVVRHDDARRAQDHGARAIVVSNHGGRQLDGSVPTAVALPHVVDATDLEVYVDGGIRRGHDVLRALALGARAVLVGRPVLWGLAANGAAGARRALDILRGELDEAMALSGCASVEDVGDWLIRP